MKILNKKMFLAVFALLQVAGNSSLYADRTSVLIVDRRSSTSDAVAGIGLCLGYGIAGIVKHCKNKKQYKKYVQTFKDMGYTTQRAQVYAQMAMNNPGGLEAVVKSIDDEQALILKQQADEQLQENKHQQTMEQMTHQNKLNLLTYFVIFLSGIMTVGLGLLILRRKQQ